MGNLCKRSEKGNINVTRTNTRQKVMLGGFKELGPIEGPRSLYEDWELL